MNKRKRKKSEKQYVSVQNRKYPPHNKQAFEMFREKFRKIDNSKPLMPMRVNEKYKPSKDVVFTIIMQDVFLIEQSV